MERKKFIGFIKEKGQEFDAEMIEEMLVRIAAKHPIELEERIDFLEKPVILECACPGWQPKHWGPPRAYPNRKPPGYKEGGVRYPAVPRTVERRLRLPPESKVWGRWFSFPSGSST